MPFFRVTVRYASGGGQRYHIDDVEAATLGDAMRDGAARIPAEVRATADLAEVRPHVDPERREFTPG